MLKLFIPITSAVSKSDLIDAIVTLSNGEPTEIDFFYNSSFIYIGSGDLPVATESMLTDNEKHANELRKINVIAEELNGKGYTVKVINPSGFLEPEIINAVKQSKPDMVVMFTQGSNNFIHDILGTTTTTILNEIQFPILVIPYKYNLKKIGKSTVGLRLDGEDPGMLQPYFNFSKKMKIDSQFIKVDSNFQLDIVNDKLMLEELKKAYPDENFNIYHRKAQNIDDGLMKFADETNSDIIVLFTTKLNLLEKIFHTSVSRHLSMHTNKPLLIYHY